MGNTSIPLWPNHVTAYALPKAQGPGYREELLCLKLELLLFSRDAPLTSSICILCVSLQCPAGARQTVCGPRVITHLESSSELMPGPMTSALPGNRYSSRVPDLPIQGPTNQYSKKPQAIVTDQTVGVNFGPPGQS